MEPTAIATGSADQDGRLVYVDGLLVAVLVKLEDEVHEQNRGAWHLEVGFERLDGRRPEPFADLQAAVDWISRTLDA